MSHHPTPSTPATGTAAGPTVLVRFFAAARAAAGTEAQTLALPTGPGAGCTRADVEALLVRDHAQPVPGQPPLGQVLARSSFLLNGVACPDPGTPIPTDAVLDVLPPFSGG